MTDNGVPWGSKGLHTQIDITIDIRFDQLKSFILQHGSLTVRKILNVIGQFLWYVYGYNYVNLRVNVLKDLVHWVVTLAETKYLITLHIIREPKV